MKKLKFEEGGRPRANDDLETLQAELSYATAGQFLGLPACVVSGCQLYPQGGGQFNIGHGLVYINGAIYRYNGESNVTLPVEMYAGAVVGSDPRPYETGGSKDCMEEALVLTRAVSGAAASTKVVVAESGILRFEKAREAVLRSVGELQWLTSLVGGEYDNTGKGLYGTKAYGWQLASNLAGRFPVIAGAGEYAIGATGGAKEVTLIESQIPAHVHTMSNAGSHSHSLPDNTDTNGGPFEPVTRAGDRGGTRGSLSTGNSGSHSHAIQPAGGGQPHENRPPFVALGARVWIGLL
jgi:microcystin-dependent protein